MSFIYVTNKIWKKPLSWRNYAFSENKNQKNDNFEGNLEILGGLKMALDILWFRFMKLMPDIHISVLFQRKGLSG